MKPLHTLNDGETVVVDLTTGTILGTNLMAAPWPESQEEQEILLADASYAVFYAQQNGVNLLTASDSLGHLSEAQRERENKMSVTEEVVQADSSDTKIQELNHRIAEMEETLSFQRATNESTRNMYNNFRTNVREVIKNLVDEEEISHSQGNEILDELGLDKLVIRKAVRFQVDVVVYAEFEGPGDEMDTEELKECFDVREATYSVPEGWSIDSVDVEDSRYESESDN